MTDIIAFGYVAGVVVAVSEIYLERRPIVGLTMCAITLVLLVGVAS